MPKVNDGTTKGHNDEFYTVPVYPQTTEIDVLRAIHLSTVIQQTTLDKIAAMLMERLPSEEKTIYKTLDGREVAAMIQRATAAMKDEIQSQKTRADFAENKATRLEDEALDLRRQMSKLVTSFEHANAGLEFMNKEFLRVASFKTRLCSKIEEALPEHRDSIRALLAEIEEPKVESQAPELIAVAQKFVAATPDMIDQMGKDQFHDLPVSHDQQPESAG